MKSHLQRLEWLTCRGIILFDSGLGKYSFAHHCYITSETLVQDLDKTKKRVALRGPFVQDYVDLGKCGKSKVDSHDST